MVERLPTCLPACLPACRPACLPDPICNYDGCFLILSSPYFVKIIGPFIMIDLASTFCKHKK
jgi:hypothetical protein